MSSLPNKLGPIQNIRGQHTQPEAAYDIGGRLVTSFTGHSQGVGDREYRETELTFRERQLKGKNIQLQLDLQQMRAKLHNKDQSSGILRLQTFKNSPVTFRRRPEALAAAGFYYMGQDDGIKCIECNTKVHADSIWPDDLDVGWMHAAMSPNCPFVTDMQAYR